MKTMIVFALLFAVAAGLFQDPSNTAEKRNSNDKDILSTVCCQYLNTNGYLISDAKLRKLCLKTYHCNDLLSKDCCNVVKARNECAKDSKLSLTYCRLTCNKCNASVVPQCSISKALGMQSKSIPDSKITASSYYSNYYRPQLARLMGAGGWMPKVAKLGEWLQVDLTSSDAIVTAIATQGYSGYWMKSYSLQYSLDGSTFKNYQAGKIFKGNADQDTVVKHVLNPPIRARYIRVLPKTWVYSWPYVRMELYGCK